MTSTISNERDLRDSQPEHWNNGYATGYGRGQTDGRHNALGGAA